MSYPSADDEQPTLAGDPNTLEDRRRVGDTRVDRGTLIGRYLVLELLGAGGMGVVYAAYDTELDRKVALKLLHSEQEGSRSSTEGQRRLLREAQAMAKLAHPNVITVHDVGTYETRVFVAMEFVDGATVGSWLTQRPREWGEVLDLYLQAGEGLVAAHAAGLVHRDFKPVKSMFPVSGRERPLRGQLFPWSARGLLFQQPGTHPGLPRPTRFCSGTA